MSKRPRRLSNPAHLIVMFTMVVMWSSVSVAEPTELAWRLEAEPVGTSMSDFTNVRLVSPTTYVRASRATIDGTTVHATDAIVVADGWRLTASHLSVDLRLDEVEITTLRKQARAE